MVDFNAGGASVKVGPDLTGFATELDTRLRDIDANLGVDLFPANVQTFATNLRAQLAGVDMGVDVRVNPDMSEFQARINAIAIARDFTVPVGIDIDSNLAELELAYLTRDRTVGVDVDLNGAAVRRLLQQMNQLGDGVGGAGSGMSSLGGGASSAAGSLGMVTAAVTALVALLPVAIGAVGSLTAGLGALGAVGVPVVASLGVGMMGVSDAFSAVGAASSAAGDEVDDSAQKQEQAYRKLGSAQKGVRDAIKDETDAREDVIRAREDEREKLEDLSLTLRGNTIDERGAVIALARARQDLNETEHDSEASGLDRAEAVQRVAESEQRLLEVQERNQDTRAKAEEANRVGIEGSAQVQQANERLTQSQEKLTQAQQELRDAQAGLNIEQEKTPAAVDKAAEAMAKLSPSAQAFVLAMRALNAEGGAFNTFQQSVQEGLFDGMAETVTNMANTVLPAITPGMTAIATSVGDIVDSIAQVLQGPALQGLVSLLDSIPQYFAAATPGFQQMITGFIDMGAAAAPAMSALGEGMGALMGQFGAAFTELNNSGVMTQAIEGFAEMLKGVGPWLNELIVMMTTLGVTVGPILGDLFASWGRSLELLTPSFNQIAGTVGQMIVDIFVALEPVLPVISQAFADMFTALAPVVPVLANLAGTILVGMAQNFSALMIALAPVVQKFAEELTPVIPILAKHFEQLAPLFAECAGVVGEALVQALDQLMPYLPEILQSFSNLLVELSPLLPELTRLALEVIPPLTDAFTLILPHIVTVLDAFTWAATNVIPPLLDAMGSMYNPIMLIGDWFVSMGQNVGRVWDGIILVIKGSIGALGQIIKGIGDGMPSIPFSNAKQNTQRFGQSMINWANDPNITAGAAAPETDGTKGVGLGAGRGKQLQAKADGGLFRGEGGPRDDANLVLLSDREFVVNADATAANLPLLNAINKGRVQGLAAGGVVGEAASWAASKDGIGYVLGGLDCSMYASGVYQILTGGDPDSRAFDTTKFATTSSAAAMGFEPGLGGYFSVGVNPLPGADGHMAFTLDGTNGESSGSNGVRWGGPALGADDGSFPLQYHLPGSRFSPPMDDSGAGSFGGSRFGNIPGADFGGDPSYGGAGNGTFNPYSGGNPGDTYGSGMLGQNYGQSWDQAGQYSTEPKTKEEKDKDFVTTSLQGAGEKAGRLAADWFLGALGLEDSILSESNTYNRALNMGLTEQQRLNEERAKQGQGQGTGTAPGPSGYNYQSYSDPGITIEPLQLAPMPPSQDGVKPPGGSANPPAPGSHVYDPAGGAEQWLGTVQSILQNTGRNVGDANIVVSQIKIESGGDPEAVNNTPEGQAAGLPIGLLQVIKTTFDANMDVRYPGTQTDPEPNIAAALNYTDDRYGGPQNIFPTTAGYWMGGKVKGKGSSISDSIFAALSHDEFVVNAESANANGPLLEAINNDAGFVTSGVSGAMRNLRENAMATSAPVTRDHSTNYGVVNVGTSEEFMRLRDLQQARENQAEMGWH
ncbi:transglycosylase SLT domain-containing protein [Rhodococcus opacus]|uniref:Hypothetical membrane protein n=1 Tax=Rhodococcus opacus (strain B4) TaxID=632772 RepID=C1B9E2_RHOOB|nr:transglycosylase SLT domain-containing protein [Rhodococcus opacus]BAH52295.1 hypothetical membrane protein [Rhodococcus opacus B4]